MNSFFFFKLSVNRILIVSIVVNKIFSLFLKKIKILLLLLLLFIFDVDSSVGDHASLL